MRHSAFLLIWFAVPAIALAQQANRKQMVYFDAKNRALPSPTGATYAVQTEYIDSLRAIERWYSGPQKIKEVAYFSNLRRRLHDGEMTTYYDDGSIKSKTVFLNGRVKQHFSFYSSRKVRTHYRQESDSIKTTKCFSENGVAIDCDSLAQQAKCPTGLYKPCTTQLQVRFPTPAFKAGAQGKVLVGFSVDRFSRLVDTWIIESASPLLNEAALKAVRTMKVFCPGYVDCETTDAFWKIPITFKIE